MKREGRGRSRHFNRLCTSSEHHSDILDTFYSVFPEFIFRHRISKGTKIETSDMIATSPAASDPSAERQIGLIGAGPGGLAAGMLLAASGLDVTIHEAQPVVGGRTRRTTVGDFAFDTGPTFFMMTTQP